jgi:multidrug efflux pump subunit AcrB
MWLIRVTLRRPIAIVVVVIALALCSILALTRMRIDIFPNLNLPVIYVAQPYGGMSPAQMEGYLVFYYEYHFLYINGIESVEDKSIQGNGLLKLTFYPGTDMSQALAQTIAYVNRARAFMPPGTVSPFVIRFDAGTVPVGYVVFSSDSRTLGEIQDLALNRVRPAFATLPGVTSPPLFGGNQRTMVVTVNPDRLRAYNMSPDEVVQPLTTAIFFSRPEMCAPAACCASPRAIPSLPIFTPLLTCRSEPAPAAPSIFTISGRFRTRVIFPPATCW